MYETTDACALSPDDDSGSHEPEPAEREPWIWQYYDRRKDAFDAAKAADLLGVSWRLAPHRSEIDDGEIEQWVVEIHLDHNLPVRASASISRDVE